MIPEYRPLTRLKSIKYRNKKPGASYFSCFSSSSFSFSSSCFCYCYCCCCCCCCCRFFCFCFLDKDPIGENPLETSFSINSTNEPAFVSVIYGRQCIKFVPRTTLRHTSYEPIPPAWWQLSTELKIPGRKMLAAGKRTKNRPPCLTRSMETPMYRIWSVEHCRHRHHHRPGRTPLNTQRASVWFREATATTAPARTTPARTTVAASTSAGAPIGRCAGAAPGSSLIRDTIGERRVRQAKKPLQPFVRVKHADRRLMRGEERGRTEEDSTRKRERERERKRKRKRRRREREREGVHRMLHQFR